MIKDTDMISVQNKVNATVVYQIPDLNNLVRTFRHNEIKKVPMDELRRLGNVPGGEITLKHYLYIDNREAVEELLGEVDPEYFYTDADIKTLLTTGSLEQFEDFLNFAPTGLKDTLKDMAVEIQVNDVKKRLMIKKYLGFDVSKAIELVREEDKDTPRYLPKKLERKADPVTNTAERKNPVRKYNVIQK